MKECANAQSQRKIKASKMVNSALHSAFGALLSTFVRWRHRIIEEKQMKRKVVKVVEPFQFFFGSFNLQLLNKFHGELPAGRRPNPT